jgi:hypothetical protein
MNTIIDEDNLHILSLSQFSRREIDPDTFVTGTEQIYYLASKITADEVMVRVQHYVLDYVFRDRFGKPYCESVKYRNWDTIER